jgi:hypothetical protein
MTLRRKAWMKCTWAVRTTGDHATGEREVRGEGSEGGSEGGARGGACVSFSSAGNACARTRTHVSSPPPHTGTHLLHPMARWARMRNSRIMVPGVLGHECCAAGCCEEQQQKQA